MYRLAIHFGDSDPNQSVLWDTRAAQLGHRDSMYNLGARLQPTDPEEARRWWERAADLNDEAAMYALGWLRRDTDPVEARRLYEWAAEHGSLAAMSELGRLSLVEDKPAALRWYRQAAEAGDALSMCRLVELLDPYDVGPVSRRRKHREAQGWLERAAELGEPRAQVALGWRLVQWDPWCARTGVTRRKEAQRWLERAAEQDYVGAMQFLGQMLQHHDLATARKWLQRGEDLGDATCASRLGQTYALFSRATAREHLDQADRLEPSREIKTENTAYRALLGLHEVIERRGAAKRLRQHDSTTASPDKAMSTWSLSPLWRVNFAVVGAAGRLKLMTEQFVRQHLSSRSRT